MLSTTAELGRGPCRPLDEKQGLPANSPASSHPVRVARSLKQEGWQGKPCRKRPWSRGSRWQGPEPNLSGWGGGVYLCCLTAERLLAVPHRSVGKLGLGRSSWQFRSSGIGAWGKLGNGAKQQQVWRVRTWVSRCQSIGQAYSRHETKNPEELYSFTSQRPFIPIS